MSLPLEGIKVLDLTGLLPGPFCTMFLGDYGADIIKIEQPRIGDIIRHLSPSAKATSRPFLMVNRNKRSLTLNFKEAEGKEIFYKLVGDADVIIEGFRPGVVKKLGIDYETVKNINPRVIYCSISGYGQDGPYVLKAGHDLNYISYAGILGIEGRKEGVPQVPAFQIADIAGGALQAINGILLALLARNTTGKGQYVDIAMLDGAIACLPFFVTEEMVGDVIPGSETNKLTGKYACYSIYKTKDEKYISLGGIEPHFWEALCKYFNKMEYVKMQYNNDKQDELFSFLEEQIILRDRDEWIEIFDKLDFV